MIRQCLIFTAMCIMAGCGVGDAFAKPCENETVAGADYTICKFLDPSAIRMFHTDGQGQTYLEFENVVTDVKARGERVVFAMNGGMYHSDRAPVGLYVEDGTQKTPINLNPGPGNFHMLPNGVFWTSYNEESGVRAHIDESSVWPSTRGEVIGATQSGPMLVLNGALHPKFLPMGTSKKIRNGVGVDARGHIYFVKSETRVNFHSFASLFRDHLNVADALYLDGTVSRIYIDGERNDKGYPMGPIIGVIEEMK